jgi:2-polyprenyl-6-methoxyphenol hydroxylase-like FAD-dependent oxidoreductase
MGDAAHSMRSAGGQGGAMGLEDCVVLTRLLKEVMMGANGRPGGGALANRASVENWF